MPLMNIVVALLARLQPSLSLLPPEALRIVNPLSKLTATVGLGSRAAAMGTRIIDFIRAFPTTITSLSTAKAGVKRLADRFPVLKSWQFWATIFTAASLLFAGLAFWTSSEAGQYAKWTAHKDFTLLCMEETTRYLSQECPDAANLSLPAPPGFHGTPTRRDLDLFGDAQDSSPAIPHPFAHVDSGYFYQHIWNITSLTPDQCRSQTSFWTTVQVAIALSALMSVGPFPFWSWKSTKLSRDYLSGPHLPLQQAALKRSGLMWRVRSYQSILLFCLYIPHRFLCSDGVFDRQSTIKFPIPTESDSLLILIFRQSLPRISLLLSRPISLCLEFVFRSHSSFGYYTDLEVFVVEAMYLSWIPLHSFVVTWPDYDFPTCCRRLAFMWCVAVTPRAFEKNLEQHYIDWIYDASISPKICLDCIGMKGITRGYPGKGPSCRNREAFPWQVGCLICLRPKQKLKLLTSRGKKPSFWYGALSDRSIWDKFGRGLDLLSIVVIAPLWVCAWRSSVGGGGQAPTPQLDSDSFMP